MPGAGTKPAITTNSPPPARLLDLTRLLSRAGRGPLTGIDRVELAYLDHLTRAPTPVFGLLRVAGGFVLLERSGLKALRQAITGTAPCPPPDWQARLARKLTPDARRAQTAARQLACARCTRLRLARMLARHLPPGFSYLNVGHSNLSDAVFRAIRQAGGGRSAVLVHDTIPLDFPRLQRPETVAAFARKLQCVGRGADLVIYNSEATRRDAERHFAMFGPVPAGLVSHLGIAVPATDSLQLPPGLDLSRPYFIAIGTIEPRKNHALLLDVWESLARKLPPDKLPHLYIVGRRGWKNEAVFQRLDKAPAGVQELGGLADGAVAALLQGARALLFPSRAEGFGLPAAEACALNVPAICADLPVYREFLGDFPVYLSVDDRYQWEITITKQANRLTAENGTGEGQHNAVALPTWADHFNRILKVM